MNNFAHCALLTMLILSFSGCASSQPPRTTYTTEANTQGLVEDRTHFPTLLYIRPQAAKIGSYDRYIVSDVRLRMSESDSAKIPPKDMEYIADYLKAAIRYELSKAGYNIGSGYGKSALRMEFVLSGFEVLGNASHDSPSSAQDRSEGAWLSSLRVSTLIVEGSFINARSKQIDAIAVSRTKPQGYENARWWSTWDDVEESLDNWAVGIREAVDKTRSHKAFPN